MFKMKLSIKKPNKIIPTKKLTFIDEKKPKTHFNIHALSIKLENGFINLFIYWFKMLFFIFS